MEFKAPDMFIEQNLELTAGGDVVKLGLTPQGWPPEPMTVKGVDAGTWAETSGARPGDAIVSINGNSTADMDKKQIIQCFKERPVVITFSRKVPTFTAQQADTRLGMQPGNWPPGLVHIRHVEPNSWASERGIEEGSAIVAVNTKSVIEMEMQEFRTLLRARPVGLSIVKSGEFEPPKSPNAMQKGLRFSIVGDMSPGTSPMAASFGRQTSDGSSPGPEAKKEEAEATPKKVPNPEDNVQVKALETLVEGADTGKLKSALNEAPVAANTADAKKSPEPKDGKPKEKENMNPVMTGWLAKRGPTITYKWLQRWCVIFEDTLVFYQDSDCSQRKGEVKFKPYSRIISFGEPTAPGDAVKHRADRPHGFAIDPDPNAGKSRRVHYFDPGDAKLSSEWIAAFNRAVSGLKVTLVNINSFLRSALYTKMPSIEMGSGAVGAMSPEIKPPPANRMISAGAPPGGKKGDMHIDHGELGEARRLADGLDLYTMKDDEKFSFTYSVTNTKMAILQFKLDASSAVNMEAAGWTDGKTASIDVEPMTTACVGTLARVDRKAACSVALNFSWTYKKLDKDAVVKIEASKTKGLETLAKQMQKSGAVLSQVKGGTKAIARIMKKAGLKNFVDVDFMPNDDALFEEYKADNPPIVWRRPKDFLEGEFSLFPNNNPDEVSPHCIKQGALGNCWFLASIAAIAEFPELIKRIFPTQHGSDVGIYEIKCWKNGKETCVIVDDYFPCSPCTQKPCYSTSSGNGIWVMLLEKAWAKLHGSYERIESGVPLRAMMDLVGSPGRSYKFDDEETLPLLKSGDLFKKLVDYDQQGFIMVTGTPGFDTMTKDEKARDGSGGIVPGHAYTLKTAKKTKAGDSLLELRNPWGKFEWDGDWCDSDSRWTESTLKELGHTVDLHDGLFWIKDSDVYKNFMDAHVLYFRGNKNHNFCGNYWAESRTEFITTKKDMCDKVVEFEVSEPAFGFITLLQRDERLRGAPSYVEFAYAVYGPLDADGNPAKEVLRSARWINREITEEIPRESPLEPGKYLIAVYNVSKTPDLPVVIATHLSVGDDKKPNQVPTVEKKLTADLRRTMMLTTARTSKTCTVNEYGPLTVAMSFLPSHGFALAAKSACEADMSVKFDFSGCTGLALLGRDDLISDVELKPGADMRLVAELIPTGGQPSFAMGLSFKYMKKE